MTVPAVRKYVVLPGKIEKFEDFMAKHQWKVSTEEDEVKAPENTIAIYYKLDLGKQAIKERLYMTNFHPKYKKDFKEISVNWIEEYFEVEKQDLAQLDRPEDIIIASGGDVFVLFDEQGVAVGTAAIIVESNESVELSKMGVKKGYQSRGYAHPLMYESLDWAKREGRKFKYVDILTSSRLTPAVTLYKKYGFVQVPLDEHNPFARADLAMRLTL
ncbi:MAG: hypothetical protein EXX96DRAFT_573129 [Benjaminiella poitrasii]|nr:MAG: hypothetical protein EXX96DRAFT_573129 [Benjaminiella poitrasii]